MTKPFKTLEKLRAGKDVTIVAIGDSLTYGWMVSKGYLDFLKEMLSEAYPGSSFKLINKGFPEKSGLTMMNAFPLGFRHFYTKKPIKDVTTSRV